METPLNATEEIMSLRAVRQIVYDHLRNAILDGTLAAGERIVERDFAARFGASRTPIREALRQLESENLVEHIPRKGVVVKGVALEEMEEIHTLRHALEPVALRAAMKNMSPEALQQLTDIFQEAQEALQQENAWSVSVCLRRFDSLLLELSRMPKLIAFLSSLQETHYRCRRANLVRPARRRAALMEHAAILNAIAANDTETAEKALSQHIEASHQAAMALLASKQPS